MLPAAVPCRVRYTFNNIIREQTRSSTVKPSCDRPKPKSIGIDTNERAAHDDLRFIIHGFAELKIIQWTRLVVGETLKNMTCFRRRGYLFFIVIPGVSFRIDDETNPRVEFKLITVLKVWILTALRQSAAGQEKYVFVVHNLSASRGTIPKLKKPRLPSRK